ncbi:MAG: hypothetical protein IKS79_06990 [Bacteroidales bacterium]|nr:hypothetical protein [Bacteroidales bacterium]
MKDGQAYYDHALSEIEKGKLLDGIDLIKRRYANEEVARISGIKDKRLLSILQDNYSKVLDNNGEPLVVYRASSFGGKGDYSIFDEKKGGNYRGFYFTNEKSANETIQGDTITLDEIFRFITALGFTLYRHKAEYTNGEILLNDVHDENVLKTPDGHYVIIDADFRLNTCNYGVGGPVGWKKHRR